MANDYIETSPATPGGKALDAESIPGAGPGGEDSFRERVQWCGATLAEVARVLAANPAIGDYGGVVRNIPVAPVATDLTSIVLSIASSGNNNVIPGVVGQTLRIHKLFLVAATAVTLQFLSFNEDEVLLSGVMSLGAGGSIVLDFDTRPWFVLTNNRSFYIKLGGAVQVSGTIYYTQS